MALSTILVGVDHSERSDKAIRRANTLALLHDAHLLLGFALDVAPNSRLGPLLERVAVEESQERAAALLGESAEKLDVRTGAGRPFEVMRDLAVSANADLIVLGAHRTSPASPGLSGSTARRLINVTPAPVLVVKDEPAGGYANVLIGYDDSNAAREALRFAHALAPNAKRTIVTACMIPFSRRHESKTLTEQFEAETRRMVEETLRQRGDAADGDVIVRVGEAFGVIMDAVRDLKPDLLVLGTSMPALYRQVFGGGIVDLIAADPPCDLLVVKT